MLAPPKKAKKNQNAIIPREHTEIRGYVDGHNKLFFLPNTTVYQNAANGPAMEYVVTTSNLASEKDSAISEEQISVNSDI